MAQSLVSPLPFYRGWHNYQELLIKALAPLSPEQLAYRPGPRLRTIGENAAHIVGARAGWLYYNLKRGDENLASLGSWSEPRNAPGSAAEIIQGLEVTWQVLQEALNEWTADDLAQIIHDTDDDGIEHTFTCQWVIWHLIEHDIHHGGEISVILGTQGLPGIHI